MKNQHHSNALAKSAFLTFKLRASENVRDVFNNKQTILCTILDETKRQASNLFRKFILKVSDWEVTTAKFTLAEKLHKTQIKFTS